MSWFYYICNYGPGHQSENDGFLEAEGTPSDVADTFLDSRYRDVDATIKVWCIPFPPQSILNEQKQKLQSSLANIIKRLSEIESQNGVSSPTESGVDEDVSKRLKRTIRSSLMEYLHKFGVMVDSNTIDMWRLREQEPTLDCRERVLDAIRRCEKYPDYSKKKKKVRVSSDKRRKKMKGTALGTAFLTAFLTAFGIV